MTVVKYNPVYNPMRNSLSAIVDDFFNRNMPDWPTSDIVLSKPSVNIRELEAEFIIDLAAPGMVKEDFKIELDKDMLKISASKEIKKEDNGEKFTRREFNFSSFSRTFAIPETIDQDKISAAYDNGILHIHLPKAVKEEAKALRTISIG